MDNKENTAPPVISIPTENGNIQIVLPESTFREFATMARSAAAQASGGLISVVRLSVGGFRMELALPHDRMLDVATRCDDVAARLSRSRQGQLGPVRKVERVQRDQNLEIEAIETSLIY